MQRIIAKSAVKTVYNIRVITSTFYSFKSGAKPYRAILCCIIGMIGAVIGGVPNENPKCRVAIFTQFD
jgi:uncharacterized membrane protein